MYKKRIERIFLAAALLLCMLAILYPILINYFYEAEQSRVCLEAQEKASENSEEIKEEKEACERYNEELASHSYIFQKEQNTELEEYEKLLNSNGNGLMGYLEIPDLQLILPVYHDTNEKSLSMGLGHLPESSLPIGGESTHAVIAGHSGLSDKRMFSDLTLLEEGDYFYFYVLGEKLIYQVDQIKTVLPSETEDLYITEGEDQMTLVTCVPYGVNTHRLLVRGTRVLSSVSHADDSEKSDTGYNVSQEETDESAEALFIESSQEKDSVWLEEYKKSLLAGSLTAFVLLMAAGYVNKKVERVRLILKRKKCRHQRMKEYQKKRVLAENVLLKSQ